MLKYFIRVLKNCNKNRRWFSLLLLLGWSVFGTASGFAQKKTIPERKSIVEASPSIAQPETENSETENPARLENSAGAKSGDARLSLQKVENSKEISDQEKLNFGEEEIESSGHDAQSAASDFQYKFPMRGERGKSTFINAAALIIGDNKFNSRRLIPAAFDDLKNTAAPDDPTPPKAEGFHWRAAIGQSLMFLAIQHGYAVTQPKTREALKGKFWKDYVDSVKSLRRWDDGGRFFTNYIAHPMQGSFTGFIYVQNDPKAIKQQFGTSGQYWRSRLKAFVWSAAWSTQFEIGPISQASIGNVGLNGKQTWGDVIVTPTVGTVMLISEDAIDQFVMRRIERATDSFYIKIFSRMLLNPTRTMANLFRFKEPWYRDRPPGH